MVRASATGRRGSYFFLIDAFIASSILLFTILLIYGLFTAEHPSTQSAAFANDLLQFLTATQLRDFRAPEVVAMIRDGNITDPRNTVATQLLLFVNQSKRDKAWLLLNTSHAGLPPSLAVNVSLRDGTESILLYNRSIERVSEAKTHLVTSGIAYALVNRSIYGPHVLTVEVWS